MVSKTSKTQERRAARYWKELERRGKEWLINDLRREVKGLNVRVLAK